MKIIVGLGNPGEKYAKTRHNVGWMFVDKLQSFIYTDAIWEFKDKFNAQIAFSKERDVILVKPQTFMNSSGEAVKEISEFYKILPNDICVIHDDLDIILGSHKIQKGKGPELHYGIKSIENEIGTKDFWRVRVGIDNRNPENRIHGEEYTLQQFTEEEESVLQKVFQEVIAQLSFIS